MYNKEGDPSVAALVTYTGGSPGMYAAGACSNEHNHFLRFPQSSVVIVYRCMCRLSLETQLMARPQNFSYAMYDTCRITYDRRMCSALSDFFVCSLIHLLFSPLAGFRLQRAVVCWVCYRQVIEVYVFLFVAKREQTNEHRVVAVCPLSAHHRGKLMIGSKMCHALLDKIKYDL